LNEDIPKEKRPRKAKNMKKRHDIMNNEKMSASIQAYSPSPKIQARTNSFVG